MACITDDGIAVGWLCGGNDIMIAVVMMMMIL
jgi:hypothetical protein